jgi:hypothetical protein
VGIEELDFVKGDGWTNARDTADDKSTAQNGIKAAEYSFIFLEKGDSRIEEFIATVIGV